jgi:hypothetical protein
LRKWQMLILMGDAMTCCLYVSLCFFGVAGKV